MSQAYGTIGFFSYRRGPGTDQWYRETQRRISNYMQHFLGLRDRGFFFDRHSLQPGVNWKIGLREGLDKSPILIAFFSPGYFDSAYCREELKTFMEREAFLGVASGSLIHTANTFNEDVLPDWAREIQARRMDEFFLLDDSFWTSPKIHAYDEALKDFAHGAAEKIRRIIERELWYREDFPKLADVPDEPEPNPDMVALLGPRGPVHRPYDEGDPR